jgi:hypothetical protein
MKYLITLLFILFFNIAQAELNNPLEQIKNLKYIISAWEKNNFKIISNNFENQIKTNCLYSNCTSIIFYKDNLQIEKISIKHSTNGEINQIIFNPSKDEQISIAQLKNLFSSKNWFTKDVELTSKHSIDYKKIAYSTDEKISIGLISQESDSSYEYICFGPRILKYEPQNLFLP